jgi:hypothetical protein
MTKTDRATLIARIDANTSFDAATVIIHRDGRITAKLNANKTSNGPHDVRCLVGNVSGLDRVL